MPSRTYRNYYLMATTGLTAVFCAINLYDERRIIQEFGFAAFLMGFWLLAPVANLCFGFRAAKGRESRIAVGIATYYCMVVQTYALKGSSSTEEQGVQHMHLYTAPLLMALLIPLVFVGVFLVESVQELWRRRSMNAG